MQHKTGEDNVITSQDRTMEETGLEPQQDKHEHMVLLAIGTVT